MIESGLITALLGIIIASILSQTIAVWVRFSNLERKITESKCPFGQCPLYARAREEAAGNRSLKEEK